MLNQPIYVGDEVGFVTTFKDSTGAAIEPDTEVLKVVDPAGVVTVVASVYVTTMPGVHTVWYTATKDDAAKSARSTFDVEAGPPDPTP